MPVALHPHQIEAIRKMHNGCVLWGDVGTGKTITALGYALEKEPYKQIVIVTTAKVRDSLAWEKEAAKLMIKPDRIEVQSWNKINDFVDYEGKFFIFDEQRLVGAGAWVKAFYKIARKNHWILLSATPGDTWSDYAPMFIANGWYKNITQFRKEHAVYSRYTTFPKIEGWINEGKLVKFRKELLVEMPMLRPAERHMHYIECDYDKDLLDDVRKRRWNVYEDKPLKNAAELYGVMRKVVSSDPDRSVKMRELIQTHPRLIVFYNFNYELEALRKICESISLEYSTSLEGRSPSISEWMRTDTGLILPTSTSTSTSGLENPEFLQSLPPWEMTQEEMTSALQEWLASSTSSTEESNTWVSKESKTSPETSPATASSASRATNPSEHPHAPQELTALTESSTRSRSDVRQSSTTTTSRQNSSHLPESLTRGRILQSTNESPTPENQLSSLTKNRNVAKQLGPIPSSSEKLSPSRSTSAARSTKTVPRKTPTARPPSPTDTFGWAEWNGHKHQPIPDTDRWVYLVQYASGSEGWNCIDTDAMAFWSLTYSWKQFNQAQGRIDRMNTPFRDLHYHVLMTDSLAEKPVIRSLEQKKDFQPKM